MPIRTVLAATLAITLAGPLAIAFAGPLAAEETDAERLARLDDPAAQRAALAQLLPTLEADKRLQVAGARCPARHFDTRSNVFARIGKWFAGVNDETTSVELCSIAPQLCWNLCDLDDGPACADLARAYEAHEDEWDGYGAKTASNRLYAFACEQGDASGCTNRGASLRNDPYGEEPMLPLRETDREACHFALFSLACEKEDAWGCTMLGQALVRGEGTPVDFAAAREAFAGACGPDANEDACEAARTWARDGLPQDGTEAD